MPCDPWPPIASCRSRVNWSRVNTVFKGSQVAPQFLLWPERRMSLSNSPAAEEAWRGADSKTGYCSLEEAPYWLRKRRPNDCLWSYAPLSQRPPPPWARMPAGLCVPTKPAQRGTLGGYMSSREHSCSKSSASRLSPLWIPSGPKRRACGIAIDTVGSETRAASISARLAPSLLKKPDELSMAVVQKMPDAKSPSRNSPWSSTASEKMYVWLAGLLCGAPGAAPTQRMVTAGARHARVPPNRSAGSTQRESAAPP
jgi:hypothetical protein